MKIEIDPKDFRVKPGTTINLSKVPTRVDSLYQGEKKKYKELLEEYREDISDLQDQLFAHDRYSLLLIFQGMDTCGKDGAIKHVMSGINPAGCQVYSFKKPTSEELDHDFLWRTTKSLPERGRIGIFNRSYYEEVLVVKVHPEILTKYQRLPAELLDNVEEVFSHRYKDINHFETFQHRNGCRILKFFLHISRSEQKKRLLERIDDPKKRWKMAVADLGERAFWNEYQKAFETALSETSTEVAPWYCIPADDKYNARLIISQIVLDYLRSLDTQYPEVDEKTLSEMMTAKESLLAEKE